MPHDKKVFSFPNEENGEGEQKEDKDVFDYPCVLYLQDAREFWGADDPVWKVP